MRISDWSSDVCSSDLSPTGEPHRVRPAVVRAAIARPDPCSRRTDPPHRICLSRRPAWHRWRDARGLCRSTPNPPPAHGGAAPYLRIQNVPRRSEEHTSELQSLMRISYAVFCLKKKTQKNDNNTHPYW